MNCACGNTASPLERALLAMARVVGLFSIEEVI